MAMGRNLCSRPRRTDVHRILTRRSATHRAIARPIIVHGLMFLLGLISATSAFGQPGLIPEGTEFQVNTYTTSYQFIPDIATHDAGFVVVWTSRGSSELDVDSGSIQAQRYDLGGTGVGSPFEVNAYTSGFQNNPAVAAFSDGSFVAVWFSGTTELRGRVFDSGGSPITDDLLIDTASSFANNPEVATHGESFVVVWAPSSGPGDSSGNGVVGRRYASDGMPLGGEFQINAYTTNDQRGPDIRSAPDGGFVVVWSSYGTTGTDTDVSSIQMRRLASDGTPTGTDFQVNSYTTGYAESPTLGFAPDSSFVVSWTSYYGSPGDDTSNSVVLARRFDSAGAPLGDDFQVNTYTLGYQYPGAVVTEPNGRFTVVWAGEAQGSSDTDAWAVVGARFDASGSRLGDEFVINTLTTGYQASPRAAVDPATGDFTVVWSSEVSAGTDADQSIQARRYAIDPLIFQDGFESGDSNQWIAVGEI